MMQNQPFRIARWTAALALSAALLAGCSGNAANDTPSADPTPTPSASPSASPSESPSGDVGKTLLEDFKSRALAGEAPDALLKALGDALPQMDAASADAAVREMLAVYEKHLPVEEEAYNDEQLQEALRQLEWPFSPDKIASIADADARALVERSYAGGYKLETAEGYVFPVVDYAALNRIATTVSPEVGDYLAIMARESDAKMMSDAALVIGWDELASRIAAQETYIRNHPGAPEREQIESKLWLSLHTLLFGANNTPNYDEQYKMLPEVKDQLTKLATEGPDTAAGKLSRKMLDILADTGDALFDKGKSGQQADIPAVAELRDTLEDQVKQLLPQG